MNKLLRPIMRITSYVNNSFSSFVGEGARRVDEGVKKVEPLLLHPPHPLRRNNAATSPTKGRGESKNSSANRKTENL